MDGPGGFSQDFEEYGSEGVSAGFFETDEFPAYGEAESSPETPVSGMDYIPLCRGLPDKFRVGHMLWACRTGINYVVTDRINSEFQDFCPLIPFISFPFVLLGIFVGARWALGGFLLIPALFVIFYIAFFYKNIRYFYRIPAYGKRTEGMVLSCEK